MRDETDVQFTPAPGSGVSDVQFTPASTSGSTGTGGTSGNTGGAASGLNAAGEVVAEAKDRVQELAATAQQKAAERVQSGIAAQKEQAVDRLSSVAQSLRSSGEQFSEQQEAIGRLITQAADRVEGFANHLRSRDVVELIGDVEDFARRQPVAFLGGAFALGVLGARFLKSSRDNLVHEGVRNRWDAHRLTSRVEDPQDAVGRPNAPGYAPPSERYS